MSTKGYKQDLPPPGGFDPITYAKKAKSYIKGWKLLVLLYGAPLVFALPIFRMTKRQQSKLDVEMQDSRIAVFPFLIAENCRTLMKQMIKNREEERELMKNDLTWEVGKLYKEPVFHNVRNRFIHPQMHEYYMHCHPDAITDRFTEHIYH